MTRRKRYTGAASSPHKLEGRDASIGAISFPFFSLWCVKEGERERRGKRGKEEGSG